MNTVNRKPTVGRTPEAFVDLLSVGIIGINKKKFLNKELQMCSAQWSAGWRFCIK
jgi:hypothetical protein